MLFRSAEKLTAENNDLQQTVKAMPNSVDAKADDGDGMSAEELTARTMGGDLADEAKNAGVLPDIERAATADAQAETPAKKPTAKKSAAKSATAKPATAKASTAKSATVKASTAKKTTAAKSTGASKSTGSRATARKSTAKNTETKSDKE